MFEAIIGDHHLELDEKNGVFSNQDQPVDASVQKLSDGLFEVRYQHRNYRVLVHDINHEESTVTLSLNGKKATVELRSRLARLLDSMGLGDALIPKIDSVKAPMPGLVRAIRVQTGDTVEKGDPLFILEAMKMENIIKAPGDGTISVIEVAEGDKVDKNQVLLRY
jgi:biotin carboxyl carrier protein